jgi:hypothetical protein
MSGVCAEPLPQLRELQNGRTRTTLGFGISGCPPGSDGAAMFAPSQRDVRTFASLVDMQEAGDFGISHAVDPQTVVHAVSEPGLLCCLSAAPEAASMPDLAAARSRSQSIAGGGATSSQSSVAPRISPRCAQPIGDASGAPGALCSTPVGGSQLEWFLEQFYEITPAKDLTAELEGFFFVVLAVPTWAAGKTLKVNREWTLAELRANIEARLGFRPHFFLYENFELTTKHNLRNEADMERFVATAMTKPREQLVITCVPTECLVPWVLSRLEIEKSPLLEAGISCGKQ